MRYSRKSCCSIGLLTIICGLLAFCIERNASAQEAPDMAKGLSAYAEYVPDKIDNYNPLNGNIFLKIPLLSYPQKGNKLHLNYYIYYSDKQWQAPVFLQSQTQPHVNTTSWQLSSGAGGPGTPPTCGTGVTTPESGIFSNIGAYIATDQDIYYGADDDVYWQYDWAKCADLMYIQIMFTMNLHSYAFFTPDGSKHYYGESYNMTCQSEGGTGTCPNIPVSTETNQYATTDGSGFIPIAAVGGSNYPALVDTNGITYTPTSTYSYMPNGSSLANVVMTDPNGNKISASSSGWIDSFGRSIPGNRSGVGSRLFPNAKGTDQLPYYSVTPGVDIGSAASQCPSGTISSRAWQVPASSSYASGGGLATYYLCYSNYTIQTSFNVSSIYPSTGAGFNEYGCTISEFNSNNAVMLSAIILPDGHSYTFDYDQYLSLTQITLPTGGSINYQWQNIPFQSCLSSSPLSRALLTRTVNPGDGQPAITTHYTWAESFPTNASWMPSFPMYSIITDSQGNDTEYQIGGADDAGTQWGYAITSVSHYLGCGPHDTSGTSGCASGSGEKLSSESYTLAEYPLPPAASGTGANPILPYYTMWSLPTRKLQKSEHVGSLSGDMISQEQYSYSPNYGGPCAIYTYAANSPGQFPNVSAFGGTFNAITYVSTSNCNFYNQQSGTAYYNYGNPGSGSKGTLFKSEATTFQWQNASSTTLGYGTQFEPFGNMLNLPSIQLTTDANGNWVTETDYCYDGGAPGAYGNLTSVQKFAQKPATRTCTNPTSTSSAPLTKTAYNSQGIVTSKTDADGNVTTFNSFACNGALPVSVTLASGYSVTYQYDCNTGKPTAFQDQNDINNSKSITYTYNDPLSRLTNITEPDGGGIQVAYALGTTLPITMQVTTTTGETAGPSVTTSTFDGLARKIQTKQQESQSSFIYTTTNYDNMGRVASQSNPYRSAGDSTYGFTTFTYDPLGRKVFEVAPDGTSTKQWCYNGLATNGQSNCNNRLGDQNGTWTDSADENNNDWQHISDAEGRLLSAIEPNGTSHTPSLVTDYAYDVLGNLQCAEQLGSGGGSFTVCSSAPTTWRPRSFTYNALSQLLTAYNPESGSLQYTYDANGNVLTKVDARGYTISYAYDNMNRLVHKNYNYNKTGVINDPSACMQYDTPLTGVNDLYPVGHMTAEWVVPSGTCPAVGTKISTIPSNAFNSTIITGHDSLGRELGNWQCPFGSNCGSTYAFNYSYDLAGNLTQFNNGMPSASSTTTSPYLNFQVTYDALSRVSQLSDLTQPWTSSDNAHPKNLLSNPVYDAMGHMTGAQVSTLPSTQTPTISISRKYDNRGRITSEIDNGQPGSGNGGITAGTISITGSENSYTNTNGTSGSTIISVSGSDGTSTFCVTNMITHVTTCRTAPNTGSLSITINGFTATASYGAGTTDAQIAVALNTGFSNSNSPVTSQYPAGSNMLILTAKATGTASNYPITIVNGGGYTITDPNNTLTGGMNGYNASDAGTITATITAPNGTTYTTSPVSWGASSTPNSIAQALASAINVATESTPGNASTNLVNATVSGSTGNINLALYHADAGLTSQFNVSVVVNDTQTSQYPTLFPYASFSANTTPINGNPQGETSATVYGYIVPPTGYAPNGNLLSYQDTVMGNWNFNYDTLNRLSTGTATSGLYNDLTGCWNYDIYGNRTQQSFQAANTSCTNTPTTTYNALNQLTSISQIAPEVDSAGTALMGTLSNSNTFTYDAAGDTTEDASNFYTYDVEGRLCMVLNLATLNYTGYFYDASGTRVAKVGLSSPTCYFGSPVYQTAYLLGPGGDQVTELAVSGGAATWKHSNLWSGTRLTATYDALGLHFHLADPLGTRRVQLSTAGAIEQSCWSLPFGDALSCVKSGLATADDATEHHFTGKERDTESGNDYFGARYLSSSAGRWLTPDWSAKVTPVPYAKMGNPQSLNLYGYIGNNPLTNFDPDGHTACGAYEGNIGACITDTASAHGDALGVYNSMLQNQTRANAVSIATGLGMIYSAFYSIFSVPVSAQLMDGRVPLINEKAPAWMHLVDGTKVSGYVYSYQAINILGGPVDCSECTLSETITKVSGNMGDDVLKNLTAPGTSWNDFIGPISDPDGKFEPGSRSNHNLQTFQITFPRGEKYTLSTVIQQNIWMLNNVLMEAYPSIIHK